jgi:hypothetical protein
MFPSYKVLGEDAEPSTLSRYLPTGAQYACRYWADHLQQAGIEIRDEGETHTFLKKYLLYLLEALSLMRKYVNGISIVLSLSRYLSTMPVSKLTCEECFYPLASRKKCFGPWLIS